MTTKHRPSLLRRLFAWRARAHTHAHDPADMGTEIGLEYFLSQAPARPSTAPVPSAAEPPRPWQAWPQ